MSPAELDGARFVEEALRCVKVGDAGHWPTVAGYLADEVECLRAAADRVRELHRPVDEKFANGDIRTVCDECGEYHPCPTLRALDP